MGFETIIAVAVAAGAFIGQMLVTIRGQRKNSVATTQSAEQLKNQIVALNGDLTAVREELKSEKLFRRQELATAQEQQEQRDAKIKELERLIASKDKQISDVRQDHEKAIQAMQTDLLALHKRLDESEEALKALAQERDKWKEAAEAANQQAQTAEAKFRGALAAVQSLPIEVKRGTDGNINPALFLTVPESAIVATHEPPHDKEAAKDS